MYETVWLPSVVAVNVADVSSTLVAPVHAPVPPVSLGVAVIVVEVLLQIALGLAAIVAVGIGLMVMVLVAVPLQSFMSVTETLTSKVFVVMSFV